MPSLNITGIIVSAIVVGAVLFIGPDFTRHKLPEPSATPVNFLKKNLVTLSELSVIQPGSPMIKGPPGIENRRFLPGDMYAEINMLFNASNPSYTFDSLKFPFRDSSGATNLVVVGQRTSLPNAQFACTASTGVSSVAGGPTRIAPPGSIVVPGVPSIQKPQISTNIECVSHDSTPNEDAVNRQREVLVCKKYAQDPDTIHCQYHRFSQGLGSDAYVFVPFSITENRTDIILSPASNNLPGVGLGRVHTIRKHMFCAFVLANGTWSFTEPVNPVLIRLGIHASAIPVGMTINVILPNTENILTDMQVPFDVESAHVVYSAKESDFKIEVPGIGPVLSYLQSPDPPVLSNRIEETISVSMIPDKKFVDAIERGDLGYASGITDWQRITLIWVNAIDMIFGTVNDYFNRNTFKIEIDPVFDTTAHSGVAHEDRFPPSTGHFRNADGTKTDGKFKPVQLIVQDDLSASSVIFPGSIALEVGDRAEVPIYLDIGPSFGPGQMKTSDLDFTVMFRTAAAEPVAIFIDDLFTRTNATAFETITVTQDEYCKIRVQINGAGLKSPDASSAFSGLIHIGNVHIEAQTMGSNVMQVFVHDMDFMYDQDFQKQIPWYKLEDADCHAENTQSYLPVSTSTFDIDLENSTYGTVLVRSEGILLKPLNLFTAGTSNFLNALNGFPGITIPTFPVVTLKKTGIKFYTHKVSVDFLSRDVGGTQKLKLTAGFPVKIAAWVNPSSGIKTEYLLRASLMWRDLADLSDQITVGSGAGSVHSAYVEQPDYVEFPADDHLESRRFININNGFPVDKSYMILKELQNDHMIPTSNTFFADVEIEPVRRGSTLVLLESDYANPLELMCNLITGGNHGQHSDQVNIVHFLSGQDMVKMSHTEMGDAISEFPGKNVDYMGIAEGIGGIQNLHMSSAGVSSSRCPQIIADSPVDGSFPPPPAAQVPLSTANITDEPGHHSLTQHTSNENTLGSSYQPLKMMDILLIAHELGHNMGAWHDHKAPGLPVKNVVTNVWSAPLGPYWGIMAPVLDKDVLPIFSELASLDIQEKVYCRFERPTPSVPSHQSVCNAYDSRAAQRIVP